MVMLGLYAFSSAVGFRKYHIVLLCVLASLREILRVQRPGKNHGGYQGETIDIRAVLREVETSAQQHRWNVDTFHEQDGFKWLALYRKPEAGSRKPEFKFQREFTVMNPPGRSRYYA